MRVIGISLVFFIQSYLSLAQHQKPNYYELPEKPIREHSYYQWQGIDQPVLIKGKLLNIHYKKIGQGRPLLLIHGLMTSSYSFRFIAEELSKRYTVIIPDLPGAGRSSFCLDVKLTPDYIADVIKVFLDGVVGKDSSVYVVGNSLGGYESVWLASKYPQSVRRLMVMHSPGFPTFNHRMLHLFSRLPFARTLYRSMSKDAKAFTLKKIHYYDSTIFSKEEIDEYSAIFTSRDYSDTFFNILKNSMSLSYMKKMRKRVKENPLPMPVLLLWAREDVMVPPRLGIKYQKLLKLPPEKLVWMEKTSHFLQVDSPEETIQKIISFDQ